MLRWRVLRLNGDTSPEAPARIIHVALRREWTDAERSGGYRMSTRGASLADVGYVHASTSAQLPGVLERSYADLPPQDLILLVLDVAALESAGSPVRWEPVPGQERPFPHIYGPVPRSAVVGVIPLDGGTASVAAALDGWGVLENS